MFWLSKEEREAELALKSQKQADDEYLSSDEAGSEERFEKRVETFKKESKPLIKHHFWWFVHNCVAHPLIGVLPVKSAFDFHDWTSKKINGK